MKSQLFWMGKNANPVFSGWHYVRLLGGKIGIRYFDNSNTSWWFADSKGMTPNDQFVEWLEISGISDNQRN